MRWTPGGRSDDLEDRRVEGGGGGFSIGGRHVGMGGILILLILSVVFHRNFLSLLSTGPSGTAAPQSDPTRDASEEREVQFALLKQNALELCLAADGTGKAGCQELDPFE